MITLFRQVFSEQSQMKGGKAGTQKYEVTDTTKRPVSEILTGLFYPGGEAGI